MDRWDPQRCAPSKPNLAWQGVRKNQSRGTRSLHKSCWHITHQLCPAQVRHGMKTSRRISGQHLQTDMSGRSCWGPPGPLRILGNQRGYEGIETQYSSFRDDFVLYIWNTDLIRLMSKHRSMKSSFKKKVSKSCLLQGSVLLFSCHKQRVTAFRHLPARRMWLSLNPLQCISLNRDISVTWFFRIWLVTIWVNSTRRKTT